MGGGVIGQQVTIDEAPLFQQQYSYDHVGSIVEKTDSKLGVERFTYDPLGQITTHLNPNKVLDKYLIDVTGNLFNTLSDNEFVNNTKSNVQCRKSIHDGIHYHYDRSGSLVEKIGDTTQTNYIWDACQRLVQSSVDNDITTYEYDPLGRRCQKTTASIETKFYWDEDVLMGDYCDKAVKKEGAKGLIEQQLRQWVFYPLTFEPLALLKNDFSTVQRDVSSQAESLFFYHNDVNGCPIRLLSLKGQVVWFARYSVWGNVEQLLVNRVDNPIRLQGQYYDEETQLSYNRYRYFDPDIGQFISQDPIGLEGGVQLYSYAPNSLSWVDPLGLLCKYLRRRLRQIEQLADSTGNSGIRTALDPRRLRRLGKEFVGEGHSVIRGRSGEIWLVSANGKRMFRSPTPKSSSYARTGSQANFHQRSNTNQSWFDSQSASNVHVHSK